LGQEKEDRFIEVIDDVLTQVLGQEATMLIYRHLENYYSLHPYEFSGKMDLFTKALRDCLSSGASPIEKMIFSELYGLKTENDS
jgi:hypothetical protein